MKEPSSPLRPQVTVLRSNYVRSAEAFLVDWDGAQETSFGRDRGTWQFMSIVALQGDSYHQRDVADDLESFIYTVAGPLVYHVELRDLQRAIRAKEYQLMKDAGAERWLERLKRDLECHIAEAERREIASVDYEWLSKCFEDALTAMQKFESATASSTSHPRAGSLRVRDRVKHADAAGEVQDGDEDANTSMLTVR
ncbi:unnamed protein product [Peniophora sp. CBMAI 1063]|nr:unnamed protein product [Peniophora sp. CBMAI 1063]